MHIYMGKVRVKNKLTKIDVTHTHTQAQAQTQAPTERIFDSATLDSQEAEEKKNEEL